MNDFEKKHSASGSDAAFTYQFYSFVYKLLSLEKGETVGYEIKDDIHIESFEGKLKLIQVKHTTQKKNDGTPSNLTNLDIDLWKTLANWVEWIKESKKIKQELESISYVLFTNKETGNIQFYDKLKKIKNGNASIENFIEVLNQLHEITKDDSIKGYINTVRTFNKGKLLVFLKNIEIETGNDDIIQKIKNKLELICRFNPSALQNVYKLLITSINDDKFSSITGNTNFSLSYDEFNQKYRNCFEEAYDRENLPIRDIPVETSLDFDSLRKEIYIRQLSDILAIRSDSDIINIHHCKLTWDNHMLNWEDILLPDDYKKMYANAYQHWLNSFQEAYYSLNLKEARDSSFQPKDDDILPLAFNCLTKTRSKYIYYRTQNLDTILSNGFFYTLSNIPEIGWHLLWEKLYKQ
ncbi:hypothetical protein [uncultured Proteiniphilum sp.]|uniref:hypothetical protein n=1 Tax=uncultured Proteiniphilum sp. TaxID=497637 RepID=UPI000E94CEB6|nr:hypothetical protein [uncultured Proteiniphilum sp.]HBN04802.1 hypothetical protein [Bacteroidales bacterium]